MKFSWTDTDCLPQGYLFLCPLGDLQALIPTSFRHPDCAAYWSLDPSGVQRLSTEEADLLGFPSTKLTMEVQGRYWDGSVYAGLREFHQSKFFDPDTEHVARELGYPLYQVSCEAIRPCAAGELIEPKPYLFFIHTTC